jgi:hypothetical protein
LNVREEIRRLEKLADLLDARFGMPGTRLRFGFDSLLGLVPGVGDGISAVPAIYIIHRAEQLGVPRHILTRMAINLAVDTAVGFVPLVGDLFDFGFKANRRNVALLKQHFETLLG